MKEFARLSRVIFPNVTIQKLMPHSLIKTMILRCTEDQVQTGALYSEVGSLLLLVFQFWQYARLHRRGSLGLLGLLGLLLRLEVLLQLLVLCLLLLGLLLLQFMGLLTCTEGKYAVFTLSVKILKCCF